MRFLLLNRPPARRSPTTTRSPAAVKPRARALASWPAPMKPTLMVLGSRSPPGSRRNPLNAAREVPQGKAARGNTQPAVRATRKSDLACFLRLPPHIRLPLPSALTHGPRRGTHVAPPRQAANPRPGTRGGPIRGRAGGVPASYVKVLKYRNYQILEIKYRDRVRPLLFQQIIYTQSGAFC